MLRDGERIAAIEPALTARAPRKTPGIERSGPNEAMAAVHVSPGNRRRGPEDRARKRTPAAWAFALPATLRFLRDRPAPARTGAWRGVPVPAASRAPGASSRPRHGGWQANGGRTIDCSRLNSGRKGSPASPGVAERRLKAVFGCGSPSPRLGPSGKGTGQLLRRFRGGRPPEALMQSKKRPGPASPSGPVRLVSHTAIGVAMGLALALLLILVDPARPWSRMAAGRRSPYLSAPSC